MSRGPGRMQRELLAIMAEEEPHRPDPLRDWKNPENRRQPGEWTTSDLASAYDRRVAEFCWEDERQIRRALDSLHRMGRIEKRVLPNCTYNGVGSASLWRLTG